MITILHMIRQHDGHHRMTQNKLTFFFRSPHPIALSPIGVRARICRRPFDFRDFIRIDHTHTHTNTDKCNLIWSQRQRGFAIASVYRPVCRIHIQRFNYCLFCEMVFLCWWQLETLASNRDQMDVIFDWEFCPLMINCCLRHRRRRRRHQPNKYIHISQMPKRKWERKREIKFLYWIP